VGVCPPQNYGVYNKQEKDLQAACSLEKLGLNINNGRPLTSAIPSAQMINNFRLTNRHIRLSSTLQPSLALSSHMILVLLSRRRLRPNLVVHSIQTNLSQITISSSEISMHFRHCQVLADRQRSLQVDPILRQVAHRIVCLRVDLLHKVWARVQHLTGIQGVTTPPTCLLATLSSCTK
jgi:hypothetical protein